MCRSRDVTSRDGQCPPEIDWLASRPLAVSSAAASTTIIVTNWPTDICLRSFLSEPLTTHTHTHIHTHTRYWFVKVPDNVLQSLSPSLSLSLLTTAQWSHNGPTELTLLTINANANNNNKKLTRRWDSERELSLRRYCTRTKNTIDPCINSATDRFLQCRFTKFSEITQFNAITPFKVIQGHRFWYQSKARIRLPISD